MRNNVPYTKSYGSLAKPLLTLSKEDYLDSRERRGMLSRIQARFADNLGLFHYNDVTMGAMASQINSLTIVYSSVYSSADQGRHQSSGSLAFVWGIHQWSENSSNAENVSIWWRHHVVNGPTVSGASVANIAKPASGLRYRHMMICT